LGGFKKIRYFLRQGKKGKRRKGKKGKSAIVSSMRRAPGFAPLTPALSPQGGERGYIV
jgi:hypothetical protein